MRHYIDLTMIRLYRLRTTLCSMKSLFQFKTWSRRSIFVTSNKIELCLNRRLAHTTQLGCIMMGSLRLVE
jgi:hypothetical protein